MMAISRPVKKQRSKHGGKTALHTYVSKSKTRTTRAPKMEYTVKWYNSYYGRMDYDSFPTMKQAQAFVKSKGGKRRAQATITKGRVK